MFKSKAGQRTVNTRPSSSFVASKIPDFTYITQPVTS